VHQTGNNPHCRRRTIFDQQGCHFLTAVFQHIRSNAFDEHIFRFFRNHFIMIVYILVMFMLSMCMLGMVLVYMVAVIMLMGFVLIIVVFMIRIVVMLMRFPMFVFMVMLAMVEPMHIPHAFQIA